jgi:hypothetical protein
MTYSAIGAMQRVENSLFLGESEVLRPPPVMASASALFSAMVDAALGRAVAQRPQETRSLSLGEQMVMQRALRRSVKIIA